MIDKMTWYLVRWEIDLLADSPEEAARQAREVQLDTGSTATCFDIVDTGERKSFFIDLEQII